MTNLLINKKGRKTWHLNNQRHRVNGPAVYVNPNNWCWCLHGRLHREDGPAVLQQNGTFMWFWHGRVINEYEQMILSNQELVNG